MLRALGALSVFVGCMLLAFDGGGNPRLASLPGPGSHGVHAFEVVGFVVAAVGVAALWLATGRTR